MKNVFLKSVLGRDFWLYRSGQLISLIGDSCGHMALAWWVLDKTGSATAVTTIIGPSLLIRLLLLPILGPLGDHYERKKILFWADFLRGLFVLSLVLCVFFDFLNIPLLILIFAILSLGSALFDAGSGGIVPQLVARDHLFQASQQVQAINALGGIMGGIIGGLILSSFGVIMALVIDSLSFLFAAFLTYKISADTKPRGELKSKKNLLFWLQETKGGLHMLYSIKELFYLCLVLMFINFLFAPLTIILPILAKQVFSMPPWYLGALETSLALGLIVGAYTLGYAKKYFDVLKLSVGGCAFGALCLMNLITVPVTASPIILLFLLGLSLSTVNIPILAQFSLLVPQTHQGRFFATTRFLSGAISPLGLTLSGPLISKYGIDFLLYSTGGLMFLLTFVMLMIPGLKEFMNVKALESSTYLTEKYPKSFQYY